LEQIKALERQSNTTYKFAGWVSESSWRTPKTRPCQILSPAPQ